MSYQPLDEIRIKDIYEKIIKPKLFNDILPSNNKTCVFLGGQPGAGKSGMADHTINQLDNKDAVVINSDILRPYHPNTPYTHEKDIYSLDPDCYKWGDMLVADCIKENKNIVFDGTFGGNNHTNERLMKQFRDNGYTTKLNLLAANDAISTIGFNFRYEKEKFEDGFSRMVNKEYHDSIYQKMPGNIQGTITKNLIDQYNIYQRNHINPGVYISATYTHEQVKTDPISLPNNFEKARTKSLNIEEFKAIKKWYEKTAYFMHKNNGDLKEFHSSILTKDKNASPELIRQISEIANSPAVNQLLKLVTVNVKRDETILKGYVGKDAQKEILPSGKKIMEFDVAEIIKGKDTVKWNRVQAWDEAVEKLPDQIYKGDFIELKGYGKTITTKDQKMRANFVVTGVDKYSAKQARGESESVTIEGRLGADAERRQIQTGNGPLDVVKFIINTQKEGEGTVKWQSCTVYAKDIEKTDATGLKKGDNVVLEGTYSPEFTNKKGEKRQDFAVKKVQLLKLTQKQEKGVKLR